MVRHWYIYQNFTRFKKGIFTKFYKVTKLRNFTKIYMDTTYSMSVKGATHIFSSPMHDLMTLFGRPSVCLSGYLVEVVIITDFC